jgi:hypothetical protein
MESDQTRPAFGTSSSPTWNSPLPIQDQRPLASTTWPLQKQTHSQAQSFPVKNRVQPPLPKPLCTLPTRTMPIWSQLSFHPCNCSSTSRSLFHSHLCEQALRQRRAHHRLYSGNKSSSSTPAMGSPQISTLCAALDAGYLTTFPGLTSAKLRQDEPQSVPMHRGHLDQQRSGLNSTKAKPSPKKKAQAQLDQAQAVSRTQARASKAKARLDARAVGGG